MGYAAGIERLDEISIFVISGIYLTVITKRLHRVVMHEMGLATFECFLYNNMIAACHRAGRGAWTMVAANDSSLVNSRMILLTLRSLQQIVFATILFLFNH